MAGPMKGSPPLKPALLYDDRYQMKPSPVISSRTEPLLRDTLTVTVTDEGLGPPPHGRERRAAWWWGDEWPTPRDVCKAVVAPFCSRTGYLRRMRLNFGLRFLLMLTSVYLCIKGMQIQIISLAKLPYYRQAGVGPKAYQQYDVVTKAPWALKAFFGALSDLYPLCGYAKRSYMSAVSVVGVVSCTLLAVATCVPSVWASGAAFASVPMITLYFTGVNLQAAVCDLLAEGRYTEAMAAVPWTGSDAVSWVWGCVQAGQFASAALVGWAADSHRIHLLFPLAAVLAAQVLPANEFGWLGDVRVPPKDRGFQVAKYRSNPRVFVLAALMALAGVGVGACNLLDLGNTTLLATSLGSSVFLCSVAFWALPPMLAKCNLYLYLSSVLYVQISGAVDYFYVAPASCVPDGPHFSFRYYITYSAVVQSVFGYIGVVLFQAWMRKWHFRAVLGATVVLEVAAGAVDLVIVNRWNISIGVPDEAMYMLGYNVVFQIASMLNFMPSVVLTSKLCPPRMEATMFALLAGFQNFGVMVAGSLGVCLIHTLGIRTSVPSHADAPSAGDAETAGTGANATAIWAGIGAAILPGAHAHAGAGGAHASAAVDTAAESECDFTNLPYAIVLSHMFLPLLSVPLAFLLLPDARLTDTIDVLSGEVIPGKAQDAQRGVGNACGKDARPKCPEGGGCSLRPDAPPHKVKTAVGVRGGESAVGPGEVLPRAAPAAIGAGACAPRRLPASRSSPETSPLLRGSPPASEGGLGHRPAGGSGDAGPARGRHS